MAKIIHAKFILTSILRSHLFMDMLHVRGGNEGYIGISAYDAEVLETMSSARSPQNFIFLLDRVFFLFFFGGGVCSNFFKASSGVIGYVDLLSYPIYAPITLIVPQKTLENKAKFVK